MSDKELVQRTVEVMRLWDFWEYFSEFEDRNQAVRYVYSSIDSEDGLRSIFDWLEEVEESDDEDIAREAKVVRYEIAKRLVA